MQKLNDRICGVSHPSLITINLSPLDFSLVSYFSVFHGNVAQALKVIEIGKHCCPSGLNKTLK